MRDADDDGRAARAPSCSRRSAARRATRRRCSTGDDRHRRPRPTRRSTRTPTCCCTTWARAWPTAGPTSTPTGRSGARRRCGASGSSTTSTAHAVPAPRRPGARRSRRRSCGTAARAQAAAEAFRTAPAEDRARAARLPGGAVTVGWALGRRSLRSSLRRAAVTAGRRGAEVMARARPDDAVPRVRGRSPRPPATVVAAVDAACAGPTDGDGRRRARRPSTSAPASWLATEAMWTGPVMDRRSAGDHRLAGRRRGSTRARRGHDAGRARRRTLIAAPVGADNRGLRCAARRARPRRRRRAARRRRAGAPTLTSVAERRSTTRRRPSRRRLDESVSTASRRSPRSSPTATRRRSGWRCSSTTTSSSSACVGRADSATRATSPSTDPSADRDAPARAGVARRVRRRLGPLLDDELERARSPSSSTRPATRCDARRRRGWPHERARREVDKTLTHRRRRPARRDDRVLRCRRRRLRLTSRAGAAPPAWSTGSARAACAAGVERLARRVPDRCSGCSCAFSAARFLRKGWVEALYLAPEHHLTYAWFPWVRPLPPPLMYAAVAGDGAARPGHRRRVPHPPRRARATSSCSPTAS